VIARPITRQLLFNFISVALCALFHCIRHNNNNIIIISIAAAAATQATSNCIYIGRKRIFLLTDYLSVCLFDRACLWLCSLLVVVVASAVTTATGWRHIPPVTIRSTKETSYSWARCVGLFCVHRLIIWSTYPTEVRQPPSDGQKLTKSC